MATFKHISSKNADYGAAEAYLTFEHDEFTMKPTLDGNGRLILRENYRISSLNCGGEDFAIACMRSNLKYGKNQRKEDVKSHHYIISFAPPRDAPNNGLTVDRAQELGEQFCNGNTFSQWYKPLYEAYRKSRNKEKYRAEHERGIILHEAAAKALKAAQIGGKLPSVPDLQAEYEKLQEQKESLYADYGKLKKQVQEYDVIKRNIDSILQAEKQPERERQTDLQHYTIPNQRN